MKVLVAIPTSFHKAECLDQFIEGVQSLTYAHKEIVFADNSKTDNHKAMLEGKGFKVLKGPWYKWPVQRISGSRNVLINYALEHNFDYIFFLDQDVVPPANAIELFLAEQKEAMCGVYFNSVIVDGKRILIPGVYKEIPNSINEKGLPSMQLLNEKEVYSEDVFKVVSCGGGCLFLHKNVFSQFQFDEALTKCEDRDYCIQLWKAKIPLFCHTKVIAKHFIKNRKYKWQNHQLVKSESEEKEIYRR